MRIYLDNAATSFPKRPGVVEAMHRYALDNGAPAGRGVYREAHAVQKSVERCRQLAAERLGASDTSRVIFTFNGTDALNLAILGLCRPGDHVVTTILEHNSVLRPLRFLSEHRQLQVTYLTPQADGRIQPLDVQRALRPETRLVAITHGSNVTGTIQPVTEIADLLRPTRVRLLVDAAQTAGHVPLDFARDAVDLLATSGHKGLGGPLGTGLLSVQPGLEDELVPLRFGGTGSLSESETQPAGLPDRYEAGNHNVPGIIGLEASLESLRAEHPASSRSREHEQTGRLIDGLRAIPGVTVHAPSAPEHQLGVVSISVEGFEPQILATLLDQEFGIQTRAGLHCAPRTHQWLGTLKSGGTVRFSPGFATTIAHLNAAIEAVRAITAG